MSNAAPGFNTGLLPAGSGVAPVDVGPPLGVTTPEGPAPVAGAPTTAGLDFLVDTPTPALPELTVAPPLAAPELPTPPPAAPASSDLAERLLARRGERVDRLTQALAPAVTRSPDEAARYARLSAATGLDPYLLRESPEVRAAAEQAQAIQGINIDSLIHTHPRAAQWLADPTSADVAHDDVAALQQIESAWGLGNAAFLARSFASAPASALQGFGGAAAGVFDLLGEALQAPGDALGAWGLGLSGAGRGLRALGTEAREGAAGFSQLAQTIQGDPRAQPWLVRAAGSGLVSAGQLIGMIPLAALSPGAVATGFGVVSSGQAYQEAKEADQSTPRAATYGLGVGWIEKWTEDIPMRELFKSQYGKTLLKSMAQYMYKEGGTEQVATFFQDWLTDVNMNPEKTLGQFLAERPEAALATAVGVAVGGGTSFAATRAINQAATRAQRQNTKAFFDALSKGVTDSKLHKRLPEKTREFITTLRESGGPQEVFIDAKHFATYFQEQGMDPAAVASDLLGSPKQLNDALTLGGDLVIPVERYAEKLAGTQHAIGLAPDLKLSAGELSPREADLAERNKTDDQRRAERVVKEVSALVERDASVAQVYEDFYQEQVAAGELPSAAAPRALLQAARYGTRAQRLPGETAVSLYTKDSPVRMRRVLPNVQLGGTEASLETVLDALRAQPAAAVGLQPGAAATWRNKDTDIPVTFVEMQPEPGSDGRQYAKVSRDGQESFVPVDELQVPQKEDPLQKFADALKALNIDLNSLTNEQVRNIVFGEQDAPPGVGALLNQRTPQEQQLQNDVYNAALQDLVAQPQETAAEERVLKQSAQVRQQRMRALGADALPAEKAFLQFAREFIDAYDREEGHSDSTIALIANDYLLQARPPEASSQEIEKARERVPEMVRDLPSNQLASLVGELNIQRRTAFEEARTYLISGVRASLYKYVEAAMMLGVLSKYYIAYDANSDSARRSTFTPTSLHPLASFSGGIASLVAERLRAGDSPVKAYEGAIVDWATRTEDTDGNPREGWHKFAQSKERADHERLNRATATSKGNWCTGGAVSTAASHLSGGDFWVYFRDLQASIAVRMDGTEDIGEISGSLAGQQLAPEDYPILQEFQKDHPEISGMGDVLTDAERTAWVAESIATGVFDPRLYRFKIEKDSYGTQLAGRSLNTRRAHDRYNDTPLISKKDAAKLEKIADAAGLIVDGEYPPEVYAKAEEVEVGSGVVLRGVSIMLGSLTLSEGATAPAVTTVGGDMALREGASAPALTTVGGHMYLYEGATAPALTTVGGGMSLYEGASAPALTTVGGRMSLYEGASAPALTTVGGRMYLYEGATAPAVTTVGKDLILRAGASAPLLATVVGTAQIAPTAHVPNLRSVNGKSYDPQTRTLLQAMSAANLQQTARGAVRLAPGFRQIELFQNANLSTVLHELSHTWLEELQRDAARPDAPQQLKDDWALLQKELEFSGDGPIPVAVHETWASWGEQYFRNGRSPSVLLREVMHKFRQWMLSIYKSTKDVSEQLGRPIPKSVSEVFDRLLATDEEIEAARDQYDAFPMFNSPEEAGMTDAEWAAYGKATTKERQAATDALQQRVMAELAREDKQWWKTEQEATRAAVVGDLEPERVYRAIREMTDRTAPADVKLSKAAIEERYGKDYLRRLSPQNLKTPSWIYAAEGGMHPDLAAAKYGFSSGDELLHAILQAVPFKAAVEQETDRRMFEKHGNIMQDGSLPDAAAEALHTEQREQLLATELKILRRKQRAAAPIISALNREQAAARREQTALLDAPIPTALLKDMAQREIGELRVREIRPHVYLMASAKAGRAALAAARKEDWATAAEEKQRQIVNDHMYRAAVKAQREVNKMERHLRDMTRTPARKRIGLAGQHWLSQLDKLLGDYSFAPARTTQYAQGLADFAEQVLRDTGEQIAIAQDLLDESRRQNYREVTLDTLRGIYDTVRSIEHVARKVTQVLATGRQFAFDDTVAALAAQAIASITVVKPLPETEAALSQAARLFEMTRGAFDTNLRPEKIFERLDGGRAGPWHEAFWNPSVDAQTRRQELQAIVLKPIAEIEKELSKEWSDSLSEGVFLSSLGVTLQRRTLIGMALNVGNEGNRTKLQGGGLWLGETHHELPDAALAEALDALRAEDWRFVQTIWDAVDQLWEPLNDLNIRAVGLPLNRVQATPVETKFGTLRGGYWPAAADARHSKVGERQENSDALVTDVFAPKFPKAATAHSFREARTGAVYPVQLDWERLLSTHIGKATTDIAYHEWVKQARRLLEAQDIKKTLQNRLGDHVYRALEEWLVHQVAPIYGGYRANSSVVSAGNQLQSNLAISALGFKVALAGANMITAPVQALHQVTPANMVRGVARFLSNPAGQIEAVKALSGEMRFHTDSMDQTFALVMRSVAGRTDLRARIAHASMLVHQYVERWTSTAIWLGKYYQETDRGALPEDAIRLADKTVRTTQMTGFPKDLSSFERDSRFKWYTLFLGPMIVLQNEMRGAVAAQSGGRGIKLRSLAAPQVWATALTTWILPAVLFELASGRGPDDDEEWWVWALRRILLAPVQMVPLVREFGNALEGALGGRYYSSRANPVAEALGTALKPLVKAARDDAEWQDVVWTSARAAGMLAGLPTGQVTTSGQFLSDVLTGEFEPEGPQDLRYLIYKRQPQ